MGKSTKISKRNYKKHNNSRRKYQTGSSGNEEYPLFFYVNVEVYRQIDENGVIESSEITDKEELRKAFYINDVEWDKVNLYYLKDEEKKTKGLIDLFTDVILTDIKKDFEELSEIEIDYINEIFFDEQSLIRVKSFVNGTDPKDNMEKVNDAFNQITEKNIWQYTFLNDLTYVEYNGLFYKLSSVISEDEYRNQFWGEYLDEESGDHYYYNSVSRVSQWEKPANCYIKDDSNTDIDDEEEDE